MNPTPLDFGSASLGVIYVSLAAFGLAVGSFLNVCIYRLPLGRSIVTPRSSCPGCGHPIRWQHNVPVLSWLLLGGRCADCKIKVSARYPAVEILNALLWLVVVWRFGLSVQSLILLPFASAMLVLFFTDYDHQLLPNKVTYPLALLGLAVAAFNTRLDLGPGLLGSGTVGGRLAAAALGALVGFGVFFTLSLTWRVLFKKDAIGFGDLKLMLGVGAFTGVHGDIITIFGGSLVGTLLALPFLVLGRWGMSRQLPFGCFLTPAALLAALYGKEWVQWYVAQLRF